MPFEAITVISLLALQLAAVLTVSKCIELAKTRDRLGRAQAMRERLAAVCAHHGDGLVFTGASDSAQAR